VHVQALSTSTATAVLDTSNIALRDTPPTDVDRWMAILDHNKKRDKLGNVPLIRITNVFFACGIEPTITEMTDMRALSGPERARSSLELANSLGTTIETAEEMAAHWTKNHTVFRPDSFKRLPFREYVWTRTLALLLPGPAFFLHHWHIPNSTPHEKSLSNVTIKVLNPLFTIVAIASVVLWVLVLSDQVKSVTAYELASIHIIIMSLCATTQSVREAGSFSREGAILQENLNLHAARLVHSEFCLVSGKTISGADVIHLQSQVCTGGEAVATVVVGATTRSTALAIFNMQHKPSAASVRRSSSVHEAVEQAAAAAAAAKQAVDVNKATHRKYNFISGGLQFALPWTVGLAVCIIPSLFRAVTGKISMFHDDATGKDIGADIILVLIIMLCTAFTIQVQIKDGLDDLWTIKEITDFTLGSISEDCAIVNTDENDALGFRMRLDNAENVESFEALFDTNVALFAFLGTYHKRAFEVLSIICVTSILIVFLGTVFELEIDSWNIMTYVWSAIIGVPMIRVFWLIVTIDQRLTKDFIRALRRERRKNDRALVTEEEDGGAMMSAEDRKKLIKASQLIGFLVDKIDNEHVSLKLFRVLVMRKDTMIKMGAALCAALLSTALRQALNM
jgi:hypothetical protein